MRDGADAGRDVILCVEDEECLRRDIADELEEAGYRVIAASSGAEALAWLGTNLPDLILCDISMPGLDGHDVLRAVQEQGAAHAEIPFIFLSALADPRQVVDGKRQGADDYLVKPIDYDLLLATVEARLRQIARIRSARESEQADATAPALSERFSLTASEIRIALALAEGRSPAGIAKDFSISRTTVAFHMRNLFQKTGTNRQAALVAMVLKAL